jgi:HK97 family phage major capsid protein
MARSAGGGDDAAATEKKAMEAKRAAFNKYCRKGQVTEELKAMSVESDPDGGYTVLPEMSAEIVKKVYESSPMRQLASVQTISSDALEMIEDLDQVGSGWVGEVDTRSVSSTAQLKKIVIPVHELHASPSASQKVLDDSMWNLESWLSQKVAEKFSRDEATAFVSGNGVLKPRGILSYASGTSFEQIEQVVSGSSGAVTADGLISLVYSLKAPYLAGAAFMMQRATVKEVRKLKDSQNRYLWEPGLNGSTQERLLGYPVYQANDMEAIAANSLSIAFGDFKAGYQIVDRFGIRVLRDPYSSKPYVIFYTTKRVGGAVKNFEAIKLQKLSA